MEIMLLRHGESQGNAQGRMQGRRDYPLSPLGQEQAALAARFLAGQGPFAAAYASPLKRAFETATIVRAHGVGPDPIIDEDLHEIAAGSLEGMNEAEIRLTYPVFMDRRLTETGDFSDYGGESYADVQARVKRVMARLEAAHRAAEDRVLVVGHGGFHYQLAKSLLCEPVPRVCLLKIGNCTVSLLRLRVRRGVYMAELVFHVPVELMGGTSGEGAARLFR
jgi:broad specificity phosphatase PhoE